MNPSQFLLYTTPEGEVKIDTVLSQTQGIAKKKQRYRNEK